LFRNEEIKHLLTDSRKAVIAQNALFFCIKGKNHDAHNLIPDLIKKGIRNFVIEKPINGYTNCTFLLVKSSIEALQKVAAAHRLRHRFPLIAIAGSNGKTIVKEWLSTLLSPEKKVVKSPKSYNSQIGVPLSIWQMKSAHEIGIFEAGISQIGEMGKLEKIIKPTFGIFTNLGSAHSEGFSNQKEKLKEKLTLFKDCDKVIIHEDFVDKVNYHNQISWGEKEGNDYVIKFYDSKECTIKFKGKFWTFNLPFVQNEYRENLLHCIITCLELGILPSQSKISSLQSLPMRMSLKKGLYNTDLIDDTYNNDLAGLQVALDFMSQQVTDKPKTLILSAMHESGMDDETLNERIQELIDINHLHQVIAIGKNLKLDSPNIQYFHFDSTKELAAFDFKILKDHLILIKGARDFKFEKIVAQLEIQVHQTVFEVNFGAFQQNLNYFKSLLKPETKVMAMVKAFAYGIGHN
jgi:alanine racemase